MVPDDAGSTADAGSNSSDGGPMPDGGPGNRDAGEIDAGPVGASDGGPRNALYAHIAGYLVVVDVTSGALTEVGPTGQQYIALAWDETAGVTRAVIGNFTPLGGATTPKLGTIDLCTGVVTVGPNVSVDSVQVRRSEALTRDPSTGVFYVTVGRNGTAADTEFISESVGTIDVATGAVTVLGNPQTLQNDGDGLAFVGQTLELLDVATGLNQGALYRIDKTNGQATKVSDPGARVLRIAFDASRGVMFAAYGEGTGTARGIGTLSLDSGALTPLGADLQDASYPSNQFTALVSVPLPSCP